MNKPSIAFVLAASLSITAGAEPTIIAPPSGFGVATVAPFLSEENVEVIEATGIYVLGDADSKLDARRLALEVAKQKATEQVGTFVQSETLLTGTGVVMDDYRVFSASLQEVEITDEALTMGSDGSLVMRVSIRAKVDKRELRSYIRSMADNAAQRKELEGLRERNAKLLEDLERINKELHNTTVLASFDDIYSEYRLKKRRHELLARIEKARDAVRMAFGEGVLLAAANASKDEFSSSVEDLEQGFWERLQESLVVSLGTPDFKDNQDGTVDIFVPVRWESDVNGLYTTLNRYFHLSPEDHPSLVPELSFLSVLERHNRGDAGKRIYAEELLAGLKERSVFVQLSIGKHKQRLIVAGPADYSSFDGACAVTSGRSKSFCLRPFIAPGEQPVGYALEDPHDHAVYQNPVVFRSIPVGDLATVRSIDAEIVLSSAGGV